MAILTELIRATLVHGATGQHLEYVELGEGVEYILEGQREVAETEHGVESSILVAGYRHLTFELSAVPCDESGSPLVVGVGAGIPCHVCGAGPTERCDVEKHEIALDRVRQGWF